MAKFTKCDVMQGNKVLVTVDTPAQAWGYIRANNLPISTYVRYYEAEKRAEFLTHQAEELDRKADALREMFTDGSAEELAKAMNDKAAELRAEVAELAE